MDPIPSDPIGILTVPPPIYPDTAQRDLQMVLAAFVHEYPGLNSPVGQALMRRLLRDAAFATASGTSLTLLQKGSRMPKSVRLKDTYTKILHRSFLLVRDTTTSLELIDGAPEHLAAANQRGLRLVHSNLTRAVSLLGGALNVYEDYLRALENEETPSQAGGGEPGAEGGSDQ